MVLPLGPFDERLPEVAVAQENIHREMADEEEGSLESGVALDPFGSRASDREDEDEQGDSGADPECGMEVA